MADRIYIKRLDVVDSTNRYARDESTSIWKEAGGSIIATVTAQHQTAGRGQRGNSWSSNSGENLLLSILVHPLNNLKVTEQFSLSQAVALAVHDAMQCYGVTTRLKWPNDIYAGNKKLAGILVELDYSGTFVEQAIIGIGLNVNQQQFPVMERTPVSMRMLLDKEFSVEDVLQNLLDKFSSRYSLLCDDKKESISREYNSLLLGIGEERCFTDATGEFTATIEGVESDGHLLLRRNDNRLSRYAFKEVEMKI